MLPLRPALYDVGTSPASSSRVTPIVTGKRKETAVPQSMKRAKICMSRLSHGEQPLPEQPAGASFVRMGMLMTWARMAPIFPMAADRPWPVDRYRVGKHSPGTIKVVVFGFLLLLFWVSFFCVC